MTRVFRWLTAARRSRLGRLARPSRRTVRFRLTLLYSSLFLLAGAGLLAITYLLMDHTAAPKLFTRGKGGVEIAVRGTPTLTAPRAGTGLRNGTPTPHDVQLAHQLALQATAQHANDLHHLVTESGIALAIMAVLAIALGWLTAGRVLAPLRAMTAVTRRIGERNLHERLALAGPGDEVKDLADTIDGLLARLEAAFTAQRQFVASASHELRTPLTYSRALIEVALADPGVTVANLRATCTDLLESGEQQERLIEALLTLATSERGLDRRERFDLATVTRRAVAVHRAAARQRGLQVTAAFGDAPVTGDADLGERMAANLIDNAIRHNVPGGCVEVRTETRDGAAVLAVANTGPVVPDEEVGRLFEPFQRLSTDRTAHPDGHGLGLSIVRAIAAAHEAELSLRPHAGGGLCVEVHFPPVPGRVSRWG